MRLRAILSVALAATALTAATAGSASAATLWTTSTHVTRVAVGTAFTTTGTAWTLTSGTATVNNCTHTQFNVTLSQNSDAGVVGEITGGSFNGCSPFAYTPTFNWTLTVSGTGVTSGTSTCWNSAIDGVRYDFGGGLYSGNLSSGVTACQPTAAAAPITFRLASAGTISGPLTGNGRIDSTFTPIGTAASYSLTN